MLAEQVSRELRARGFTVVRSAFTGRQLDKMEEEYGRLSSRARDILASVRAAGISFTEYYERYQAELIAVPEQSDPTQLCRFEYIAGTSAYFRDAVAGALKEILESALERQLALFKDKCNLKAPGGGQFGPHQDIPAYADFGPDIYLTAAVSLDESTCENGALEFAVNYREIGGGQAVTTGLGRFPLFEAATGGASNGEIVPSAANQFSWDRVCCEPGDVVLFDSYVPHRSGANLSNANRRMLFFTFNLKSAGDLYETYYREKRRNFANPKFHIATPTFRN